MIENLSVIRDKGYRALMRELGAAGTVVFLRQFDNGNGNYTEDRRAMLEENSVETIAERIRKRSVQQVQQA